MSRIFREFLRKIGSGTHTGEDLTRAEAAMATRMMLLQEATPAQMGAFMIAHRIKRPTGEELAGMLDAYAELGPKVEAIESAVPVTVFCSPYDGRDRTAPISPLTTLVLSAAGCPVLLHGGERMPTKEGAPLVEFWQGLGIDWRRLTLDHVHQVLSRIGVGFVYLPLHFPFAQSLVPYREQIGKRPPFATLELMWSPYAGKAHVVTGFVHPPTENLAQTAFTLRGTDCFTTVKGLEGSCDLPRERTAIIGLGDPCNLQSLRSDRLFVTQDASQAESSDLAAPFSFTRLHLVPRDYGFASANVPFTTVSQIVADMQAVLQGRSGEMMQSAIWNGGFYLWRCGACQDLAEGFSKCEEILTRGWALQKLEEIQTITAL
jgi:anthranilate phosphoribosyltransferase